MPRAEELPGPSYGYSSHMLPIAVAAAQCAQCRFVKLLSPIDHEVDLEYMRQ